MRKNKKMQWVKKEPSEPAAIPVPKPKRREDNIRSIEVNVTCQLGTFFVQVDVPPVHIDHLRRLGANTSYAWYDIYAAVISDIKPMFNPENHYRPMLYIDGVPYPPGIANISLINHVAVVGCYMVLYS